MRGSNQGGSLAGFVVIGAFLVLVLVGGLYGLNRYNAEQQKKQEIAKNEEKPQPSSSDKKTNQSETKPQSSSSSSNNTPEAKKPDSKPSSSTNGSSGQRSAPSTDTQSGASQLPQTGPADAFMNSLAVVLLSFATVSYIQSRAYARQRSLR